MSEVIMSVGEDEVAQPLSFWGWFFMVWTDILFNFEFEKDWPTVAVFFATLCLGLVVFYEMGKSFGLLGQSGFFGLTKMLPGTKKASSPYTVELKVDEGALRAIDTATRKELWKVSYFAIVNWGYSDRLFQVIFADQQKREQTVSFATNQGKAISEALHKKIDFLQERIESYVSEKSKPNGNESSNGKKNSQPKPSQNEKKESSPKEAKKEAGKAKVEVKAKESEKSKEVAKNPQSQPQKKQAPAAPSQGNQSKAAGANQPKAGGGKSVEAQKNPSAPKPHAPKQNNRK